MGEDIPSQEKGMDLSFPSTLDKLASRGRSYHRDGKTLQGLAPADVAPSTQRSHPHRYVCFVNRYTRVSEGQWCMAVLVPAPCCHMPWEAAVMAQVVGALPPWHWSETGGWELILSL